MTSEELPQRAADLGTDIEATRLDFLQAVLEMDRIAQDEAIPATEKLRRLENFWNDFRWTPRSRDRRGE